MLHGECHVWRIALLAEGTDQPSLIGRAGAGVLDAKEQARANRFLLTRDQQRFVARRVALRWVLASYLEVPPAQIEFQVGAHGKPELAGWLNAAGWNFNCTHSGNYALIAVARNRSVGVDLEQHSELSDLPNLVHTCLSPAERAVFFRLSAREQPEAFFRCWTRKEAFLKALGWGLAFPPPQCTVAFAPGAPPAVLAVRDAPELAANWGMQTLAVAPGYSAALVTQPREFTCQGFDFLLPHESVT